MHHNKNLFPNDTTKYIFVSGGVISGLGKGTLVGALSTLLESCKFSVYPLKVDMYLNIDAGTMNPLEHGETFVTDDALECDQDIGTYERFLHRSLNRSNYCTAGQVYQSLLNNERQLKYGGKCVEAFPHIPLESVSFFNRYPADTDIAIIEFGGTVGEYQNEAFFEAARMMVAHDPSRVCFVHVGWILQPSTLGEQKSKPMQMSIRELNDLGIFPDVVVCRAEKEIDEPRRQKVATAAGLPSEYVYSCPNVNSIYQLPALLQKQQILKPILEKLDLAQRRSSITPWITLAKKINTLSDEITIGIAAKYYTSGEYGLEDSYISVIEALEHAAWHHSRTLKLIWIDTQNIEKDSSHLSQLDEVDAVIVPQGWGSRGSEGKITTIKHVRENSIPYLGLCYGMQMACIEYARNVAGLTQAHSEEVKPKTKHPIVHIMPEQKTYLEKQQYGGTIRLGGWPCKLKANSKLKRLYKKYGKLTKNSIVRERHRHRYEFNTTYTQQLEKAGMIFSGLSPDGKLVEAVELAGKDHPYFIATQFHPELISRPHDPHPLFLGLIAAAIKQNRST